MPPTLLSLPLRLLNMAPMAVSRMLATLESEPLARAHEALRCGERRRCAVAAVKAALSADREVYGVV